jgi:hypothetical protein
MVPKKTRKKSKGSKTAVESLSSEKTTNEEQPLPLSKAEKINIENLFAHAYYRYAKEELADKKNKQKELSHLANIAEEYLSCYMLIGYSLQNEQVVIFNANTPKDESALVDLLRSVFIDLANNRP